MLGNNTLAAIKSARKIVQSLVILGRWDGLVRLVQKDIMQSIGVTSEQHKSKLAPDGISGSGEGFTAPNGETVGTFAMRRDSSQNIAILLGTYQGQNYLSEQLNSFTSQTYSDWDVYASDDGSTDDTLSILKTSQAEWKNNRLSILSGPGNGFVANFLSLACNLEINAAYFAFSDQDDIWKSDKLQRAVDWLKTVPENVPALYCTRTQLIDESGKHLGYSPLFTKAPSFPNALVQSIGGANTMVFNRAARNLLREAGDDVDVSSHDCWAYLVVSACGGRVYHDVRPTLLYRQHGGNVYGANTGWSARLQRLRMLFDGYLKDWNDRNIKALQKLRARMTPENKKIFDSFAIARNSWLIPRMVGIWKTGTYRQGTLDNVGLVLAALFKKI